MQGDVDIRDVIVPLILSQVSGDTGKAVADALQYIASHSEADLQPLLRELILVAIRTSDFALAKDCVQKWGARPGEIHFDVGGSLFHYWVQRGNPYSAAWVQLLADWKIDPRINTTEGAAPEEVASDVCEELGRERLSAWFTELRAAKATGRNPVFTEEPSPFKTRNEAFLALSNAIARNSVSGVNMCLTDFKASVVDAQGNPVIDISQLDKRVSPRIVVALENAIEEGRLALADLLAPHPEPAEASLPWMVHASAGGGAGAGADPDEGESLSVKGPGEV
jgi:hypothetical protein